MIMLRLQQLLQIKKKLLRWFLQALSLCMMTVVVLAIFLWITFDPNDYKLKISQYIYQKTGRTLLIDGKVHLDFSEGFTASIKQGRLSESYNNNTFLSFDELNIRLEILPWLKERQLVMNFFKLKRPTINLIRYQQGNTNIDDLLPLLGINAEDVFDVKQKNNQTNPRLKTQQKFLPNIPPSQETFTDLNIKVGGVVLQDAYLRYQDDFAKQYWQLAHINLHTNAWRDKTPFVFEGEWLADQGKTFLTLALEGSFSVETIHKLWKIDLNTIKILGEITNHHIDANFKTQAFIDFQRAQIRLDNTRIQSWQHFFDKASIALLPGGKMLRFIFDWKNSKFEFADVAMQFNFKRQSTESLAIFGNLSCLSCQMSLRENSNHKKFINEHQLKHPLVFFTTHFLAAFEHLNLRQFMFDGQVQKALAISDKFSFALNVLNWDMNKLNWQVELLDARWQSERPDDPFAVGLSTKHLGWSNDENQTIKELNFYWEERPNILRLPSRTADLEQQQTLNAQNQKNAYQNIYVSIPSGNITPIGWKIDELIFSIKKTIAEKTHYVNAISTMYSDLQKGKLDVYLGELNVIQETGHHQDRQFYWGDLSIDLLQQRVALKLQQLWRDDLSTINLVWSAKNTNPSLAIDVLSTQINFDLIKQNTLALFFLSNTENKTLDLKSINSETQHSLSKHESQNPQDSALKPTFNVLDEFWQRYGFNNWHVPSDIQITLNIDELNLIQSKDTLTLPLVFKKLTARAMLTSLLLTISEWRANAFNGILSGNFIVDLQKGQIKGVQKANLIHIDKLFDFFKTLLQATTSSKNNGLPAKTAQETVSKMGKLSLHADYEYLLNSNRARKNIYQQLQAQGRLWMDELDLGNISLLTLLPGRQASDSLITATKSKSALKKIDSQFNLNNGIFKQTNLKALFEQWRITGKGQVDLTKEQLKYTLHAKNTETKIKTKIRQEKGLAALRSIFDPAQLPELSFQIVGSLVDPQVMIDWSGSKLKSPSTLLPQ